jgi:chaperonin GroEL
MTNVSSGEELKEGIKTGVKILNSAVGDTLGPFGRSVLVRDQYGKRKATKDGVTVAKSFGELEDEVQDYGLQMVKEVSIKSAIENGDGTTTANILATSIILEGYKVLEGGSNVVQVKKGIDDAVKQIVENLKKIKVDITEDSQIKEVATISGNNDSEIGELIAAALDKVGREGVVSIEKSKSGETSLEVVEGMQFDRGYKSPYFVTDNDTMTSTLDKPLIMLYNGRITSAQDIVGVMNLANIEQRSLLIIAEDIDGEALSTLVVNKMRGIVNSVAVKAPDFGDRRTAILEDLAIVIGGEVISPEKGYKLDKLSNADFKKYLGTARVVTVSKEKTTIVDGDCAEENITKRGEELKKQIDSASSPFEKEKLQERLGKMIGGVAVISVGGNSELEIDEKKDRVEDALFATKSALEEGILPGGGTALLYASQGIEYSDVKDIKLGQEIVYKACYSPFNRILLNAGYEEDRIEEIYNQIIISGKKWDGYDLKSETIVNMKDNGILDPMKVTKGALINASSIAGTILTTNNLVYEKREDRKEQNPTMY